MNEALFSLKHPEAAAYGARKHQCLQNRPRVGCVHELPGFPAASAWKNFSRNHGSTEKLGARGVELEHLLFEYRCPTLHFPALSFGEGCTPLGWLANTLRLWQDYDLLYAEKKQPVSI